MKPIKSMAAIFLAGVISLSACKSPISGNIPNGTGETPTNAPEGSESELLAATKAVISQSPKTFCNPINIGYQYQAEYKSRESADPSVIKYKGDYYLFASHGSGYWWSKDLVNWNFIHVTRDGLPIIDNFAPGVCIYNDELYINASGSNSTYKTSDPKSGQWEFVSNESVWYLDPALFADDDGKVYNYYGFTSPLYVVELDPQDMTISGERKRTIYQYPMLHGFEVSGDLNTAYRNNCIIEGPWMTKYNGKYYLQYATPGTEYGTYANGCYVSDSPTGPFVFAENNPISYKATGFLRGAGHGSLIEDDYGHWWKFDTVSISVNHPFERRLMMYPAKFDQYGQLVTNTVFADYPMYYPSKDFDFDNPGPDWQLLSYNKKAESSSQLGDNRASKAFDENIKTWWSAETGNAGEWLSVDLGKICDVRALQINFADQDCEAVGGRDNKFVYRYTIEFSQDGQTWYPFVDRSDATGAEFTDKDRSHDYYELENFIGARYFKVTNKGDVPANGKFAISGLRIFGYGGSKAPEKVTGITIKRNPDDERYAEITWKESEGAEGYIIRYGNKSDSRYIHKQIIGANTAMVANLNVGVDYYFTIDAYNDSGITMGTEVIEVPSQTEHPVLPGSPDSKIDIESLVEIGDYSPDEGYEVYTVEDGRCKNVDAGESGYGTLRVRYSNENVYSDIEIIVNGKSQGVFHFPTTGTSTHFRTASFEIELKPGKSNAIELKQVNVQSEKPVNYDSIQFIY